MFTLAGARPLTRRALAATRSILHQGPELPIANHSHRVSERGKASNLHDLGPADLTRDLQLVRLATNENIGQLARLRLDDGTGLLGGGDRLAPWTAQESGECDVLSR